MRRITLLMLGAVLFAATGFCQYRNVQVTIDWDQYKPLNAADSAVTHFRIWDMGPGRSLITGQVPVQDTSYSYFLPGDGRLLLVAMQAVNPDTASFYSKTAEKRLPILFEYTNIPLPPESVTLHVEFTGTIAQFQILITCELRANDHFVMTCTSDCPIPAVRTLFSLNDTQKRFDFIENVKVEPDIGANNDGLYSSAITVLNAYSLDNPITFTGDLDSGSDTSMRVTVWLENGIELTGDLLKTGDKDYVCTITF